MLVRHKRPEGNLRGFGRMAMCGAKPADAGMTDAWGETTCKQCRAALKKREELEAAAAAAEPKGKMKRASYRHGVEWIALNDEPSEFELQTISESISVMLLADIFGLSYLRVAGDVLRQRTQTPVGFRVKQRKQGGRK